MGAGLLANAVYQNHIQWLTHCIREQARSHIFDLHVFRQIDAYLRAMMTARIGAGSPSMVLLWSSGSRKSLRD